MPNCISTFFRTTGFVFSTSVLIYNLKTGPEWWPPPARARMRSVLALFMGSNVLSLTASQILANCDCGLVRFFQNHPYTTIFGAAMCVSYCKLKMKKIRDSSRSSTQDVNIAWFSYSIIMGIPFSLFPSKILVEILPTYVTLVGFTVFVTNTVSSLDYEMFSIGWIIALCGMAVFSVSGLLYFFAPKCISSQLLHQSLVVAFFGILLDEFQFAKKRIMDTGRIPDHKFNPAYVSFPLFVIGSVLFYRLAALSRSSIII